MSEIATKDAEQRLAEAEVESFKHELGPFVVAAEATRMPMVFTDARTPDNAIIFANDSFLKLTGYDREEVLAQSFDLLMARGAATPDRDAVEAEFAGESDGEVEILCRRKSGTEFWCQIMISSVKDDEGTVVQHFASFIDLSRHKESQRRDRLLIDELNHRVKNTLSTVQSIVSQTLRAGADPVVMKQAIEGRLLALARSHDLLTSRNWETTGLHDVVDNVMEPFGVANGRVERLKIEGENIPVTPKLTLALSIALHELATNAVKYGAFSGETGVVLIDWTIGPSAGGDRLVLRWRERGGPPVAAPDHKGFGSRVLERGLSYELQGSVNLDFRPDGVVCTIDIPAP